MHRGVTWNELSLVHIEILCRFSEATTPCQATLVLPIRVIWSLINLELFREWNNLLRFFYFFTFFLFKKRYLTLKNGYDLFYIYNRSYFSTNKRTHIWKAVLITSQSISKWTPPWFCILMGRLNGFALGSHLSILYLGCFGRIYAGAVMQKYLQEVIM